MKGLIYLCFGLTAGAVPAFGQSPFSTKILGQQLHLQEQFLNELPPLGKGGGNFQLITIPNDRVRVMGPDKMPCVVPSLTFVEKMPVLRSRNGDPMPNGVPPEKPITHADPEAKYIVFLSLQNK